MKIKSIFLLLFFSFSFSSLATELDIEFKGIIEKQETKVLVWEPEESDFKTKKLKSHMVSVNGDGFYINFIEKNITTVK